MEVQPFLLRFNPKVDRFFACRNCKIEIAKIEDFVTHYQGWELAEPIFRNIINVYTSSPPVKQQLRGCPLLDMHCKKCCNLLGKQFFEAPRGNGIRVCRDYMPDLKQFMKWDGHKFVDVSEKKVL